MSLLIGALTALAALEAIVIFNLSRVSDQSFYARSRAPEQAIYRESLHQLRREARSRAALYNALIERDMLLEGMVVDRDESGNATHLCDSLLFSALRYRSLVALEFNASAAEAWKAIDQSRDRGRWWRHPLCAKNSLSRDMLMGVLVALEGNPPEAKAVLVELLAEISARGGSFSDGPFFVSYLSPGPAGLVRHFAESLKIPYANWPWVLKQSFSSVEFDALFIKPGYESHLAALGLWLEQQFRIKNSGFNARSALGQIDRILTNTPSDRMTSIDLKRMLWISNLIAQGNPGNLFFETLWLDINGLITDDVRAELLAKLLAMPQFPEDRLPMNCDKDADYLWQRKVAEYQPVTSKCNYTYSGVDFLWMAGILAQDLE